MNNTSDKCSGRRDEDWLTPNKKEPYATIFDVKVT